MLSKNNKEKIKELKKWFVDRTIKGRDIITYNNGFTGIGILKKPQDHITKKINKVFILDVGLNYNGTSIRKNISAEMTISEVKKLSDGIKYVLSENKK